MDTIMKNILKTLALGLALVVAASCDLSEYNPNEYGAAMAYGSESNIRSLLYSFYSTFPSLSGAYSKEQSSVDYMTTTALSSRFQSTFTADEAAAWGDWDDLRNINLFLTQMNSPACGVEGALKDNFVGQGRFLRGYWYFKKLRTYGDMPWFDHVIAIDDPADEYKDRDSRDLIVKNMLEDLDYAIANVTDESVDHTWISKEVIQFIKMQACLYEASFRKYNNVTASAKGEAFANYTVEQLYRLAAETAESLIGSGKYSLVADYRSLFTSDDLKTEEVILGAETSSSIKGSQNNYYNYADSNPRALVRTFINTFLMADGTPYTSKAGFENDTFAQEFANRDPRLAKIVRTPGYKFAGSKVVPNFTVAPTGYQIIKFCLDKYAYGTTDEQGSSNTNAVPVFRYPEVLLSYAEAKAELGEMTDAIWAQTVGAIRKRAGITGSSLTTVPTAVDNYLKTNFYPNVDNAAILEIRRERACELCLEGQRYDDLIRWGCGNDLASVEWTGINLGAGLNTKIDVDGDGTDDVYFYTGKKPSEEDGIQYILVNNETGLQLNNNRLSWTPIQTRYWASDGHLRLAPMRTDVITEYQKHGYTLTQNPGY